MFKKLLLLLIVATSLFSQTYVMSVSSGTTLCVANKLTVNGAVEIQMRCYNTSILNNGSYQMLLNTSILDTASLYSGGIGCFFQKQSNNMLIQCGTDKELLYNQIITP